MDGPLAPLPFLVGLQLRRVHHGRVEDGVGPQLVAVGDGDLAEALDEQVALVATRGQEAVGGAPRNHQVVAGGVVDRAEGGLQLPAAGMDVVDIVAVGIAVEEVHGRGRHPVQGHVRVVQEADGREGGLARPEHRSLDRLLRRWLQPVQVVAVGPQRPFDARPVRHRVEAVEVRGAPEEAVARVLLLEGARGQVHVRLARVQPLAQGEERRFLLGHGSLWERGSIITQKDVNEAEVRGRAGGSGGETWKMSFSALLSPSAFLRLFMSFQFCLCSHRL